MNEVSRPARRLPDINVSVAYCNKLPDRRLGKHPEALADDEMVLAVRLMATADRAVAKNRRAA
jgi:hypothetical protein